MATGDINDMRSRIIATLPNGWFANSNPVRDAVISGGAYALSLAYSILQYTKLQARISTATDGFLDLISYDFFGSMLPRSAGELDNPFRQRILANLLRERATRKGLTEALTILTGRAPKIFEPTRPPDTGCYNENNWGYNLAGGYGSLDLNNQFFVTAYRASNSGIPYIAGYGVSNGAYNTASQTEYASLSQIVGAVTDASIFAAVDAAKAAGTIAWAQLSN